MTRVRMVREAGAGEPVHVWQPRGALPREFVWRGQRFRVRSVEAQPGVRPGGASGARLSLRTTSGWHFVLRQDPSGGWRVDRLLSRGGAG